MIRVAVLGCGYWGQHLVRHFSALGVLAAIAEPDVKQAQMLSEKYHVPVKTLPDIYADQTIHAVVIAAPAAKHATLTLEALLAGKHVFVEKPLALNLKEAEQLCQTAEQQRKILMVGHLLQYHSAFLTLKQMVANGELGRLQYLYSNRLNLGKFRQEENILWSFAPHDVSMILALVGTLPDSVYTEGTRYLNPGVADVTTTHLRFAQGIHAHIFVSWLNPYKEQKLVVVGERGMAVFDDGQPWERKLVFYPHQVNWVNQQPQPNKAEAIPMAVDNTEPLRNECQHFLNCIQQNAIPQTDGFEGLRVLRVLQAAESSMQSGVAVSLMHTSTDYFVHPSAYVDEPAEIGEGTKIWHFSHVMPRTKIGRHVVVGQNVAIGPDAIIGDYCKIQNNVSIYKGVILEQGVFCGPSCVFTNVNNPRAEVERKEEFRQTIVERGTTIGANATIVCGVRLGAYSFVGAGAVVTKDVLPYALVVGNPAKQMGWVSQAGERLGSDLICPREGTRYRQIGERLEKVE